MGIFDSLGLKGQNNAQQPQQQDPRQMQQAMRQEIGKISAHPSDYLRERGFNVPADMTDARQITQYLLQTGQIGNQRLQQVMQMIGGGKR